MLSSVFYGEQLSALSQHRSWSHPLSAVRNCLFIIFAATLHIGGISSVRNLRVLRDVVTGTHTSRPWYYRYELWK